MDVADRRRAQHDRAAAAEVLLPGLDAEVLQRLVDRGGRQVRVEVAALAVVDGAVGEHDELGAVAHAAHGLLLEALDRPGGALGLEQRGVDRRRPAAELLPEVLEQPGLVLAGDPAVDGVAQRREVVVAAEQDRERRLHRPRMGRGIAQGRAPPEDGAGGEVLHLALAVDRRVRDDGDRLLEVVGEVLALRAQGGQRPVVAERADRLGAVGGHLLDELDVVALPAETREDAVGDLHRLGRAGGGVAGDVRALKRPAGSQRAVVRRRGRNAGAREPAPSDLPLHLVVLPEPRAALARVDGDHQLLPWPERQRLGDHVADADDAGLGAEDVVVGGLEPPQRAQPERVR